MATNNETWIRQADAKISVTGILAEKKLEFGTDDNGVEKVTGSITVKTSPVNFAQFNINANRWTKNGDKENPSYVSLRTVDQEYKAIADEGVGEDNATRVSFTGDMNPYVNRNGKEVVTYRASFLNRYAGDPEEMESKAEFEVEMFIESIVPEIDHERETGNVLIKGQVPSYGNGINPITLKVPRELRSAIERTFHPGQTAKFYGDAVNNRVTETREIPVAIGRPRTETTTTFKNDLIVNGATAPYMEGSNPEPYAKEVVERAKNEAAMAREARANTQATPQRQAKPSGAARGRSLGAWS